ncbi:MAG: AmmeMemoRadiSam system protein A [Lachnospiraceae bacterium]|nr:AmmeMemoRadiSam system protein A [Lachnospiraceae bacterium]
MGIKAAFMVPHPPLIVHEVGRGGEEEVRKTIDAYETVAREVAALAPDTIIVSSPHSIMYQDYFHISPGLAATGSFANFHAPEVRFDETYDMALVHEIEVIAGKDGFPAGTLGGQDPALDHGTMVPLYFIRKYYKGGKIVRIGLSGLPLTDHYKLGQIVGEAVRHLGINAVFIASGDLSHKLQVHGPYGFAREGPEYDARIMDVMSRGSFGELFDFDENFCDKAAECGHRSFVIMAGVLDGTSVTAKQYVHEDVTGVGYGICSFYPGAEDDSRRFLKIYIDEIGRDLREKREKADAFVRLARLSLESYIKEGNRIEVPADLPAEMTMRRAGAFVSIHKLGKLRGCIGTILPTQDSIANEIIDNAISASTRDPRFEPITEEELPFLDISVDILGEPEDIDSASQLDVKRYGVIVTSGRKRGLLLPDLDGVDTVTEQINIAKRKAGIYEDEPVRLQRFEVIRHF